MLTRCTKAYSSSCSQIVFVYLQPFRRNSLLKCQRSLKTIKFLILGVQGLSKSSMLIIQKSSSLLFVVIGSMPMPICNHFHFRLVNRGKMTSRGYCSLMPSCADFLEPKRSRLGPLKSMFNAENFILSLS